MRSGQRFRQRARTMQGNPAASAALVVVLSGFVPAAAAAQGALLRDDASIRQALLRWNRIAIDASGLDHTYPAPGDRRVFGEQLGPGRSSRAMAITHIAMFEAINAAHPLYLSYTGLARPSRPVDVGAAVAQAAHDTLTALFPAQAAAFDARLEEDLRAAPRGGALDDGIALGRRSAEAILAMRAGDGSHRPEMQIGVTYTPRDEAGHWRPDPISRSALALGAQWGSVRTFVLTSPEQFRTPPPPPLDSDAYAEAFAEVRAFGGDGIVTPTVRSEDETLIGIYWAYDGMPSLCAPPRLYNQIAVTIADLMQSSAFEVAHLLALVNVAMADAGVAIWESKYFYDVWRPVTGVREADAGSGPTGAGDANPRTIGDPTFTPLGAPSTNLAGPNFTPPFPAYPSGHAGFGGALFQVLRRIYGRDDIPFTFVSDELNGETVDNLGRVRPLSPRRFPSLSAAEEENAQSRIYLGIHWAFDKTAGIAQGRQVADFVVDRLYVRRRTGPR